MDAALGDPGASVERPHLKILTKTFCLFFLLNEKGPDLVRTGQVRSCRVLAAPPSLVRVRRLGGQVDELLLRDLGVGEGGRAPAPVGRVLAVAAVQQLLLRRRVLDIFILFFILIDIKYLLRQVHVLPGHFLEAELDGGQVGKGHAGAAVLLIPDLLFILFKL